jgi:hypothetical protein
VGTMFDTSDDPATTLAGLEVEAVAAYANGRFAEADFDHRPKIWAVFASCVASSNWRRAQPGSSPHPLPGMSCRPRSWSTAGRTSELGARAETYKSLRAH